MTTVAILPVPTEKGISYQGSAGDKHSRGRTLGEALDALTPQLPDAEAAQQQRLGELMASWRQARDSDTALRAAEQEELDALIEAELSASASRTARLADEAGR